MGLINKLKKAFLNKKDVPSIQSIDNRFKSIELEEKNKIGPIQSINTPKKIPISTNFVDYNDDYSSNSPNVEKNSYELGLAAGYTGHSIKQIENSLNRIESQMVTKDWFLIQFNQLDRRIEDIERALGIIKGAIPTLEKQKSVIKIAPLTPKMQELLEIIKEFKEISFADLALKMNMNISDLRSILSIMAKRTNEIERYRKNRNGMIKYVSYE